MKIVPRHLLVLLAVLLLMVGCTAVRNTVSVAESPETPTAETAGAAETAESAETVETIEEFWSDGSIRLRREVVRGEDGSTVDHGVYARWHENGLPEYETVFDLGRKDGRAVRWHMNGEIWIEEFYVKGLKEGACRTWNETGDLVKEEQYAHGKPHGTWTVWKKGVVRARSCFDHGVPVECPPEQAPHKSGFH
jgi:hypothetical protein